MQLKILGEYVEFKRKAKDLMNPDGENEDISPLAKADSLGRAAINRYFGGGRFLSNLNFPCFL